MDGGLAPCASMPAMPMARASPALPPKRSYPRRKTEIRGKATSLFGFRRFSGKSGIVSNAAVKKLIRRRRRYGRKQYTSDGDGGYCTQRLGQNECRNVCASSLPVNIVEVQECDLAGAQS